MYNLKYDVRKFREYASDKENLKYYLEELTKHSDNYYSFNNLELALAVANYISTEFENVTFHCFLGQKICVSDEARYNLRSKMVSYRNMLMSEVVELNNSIDEIILKKWNAII